MPIISPYGKKKLPNTVTDKPEEGRTYALTGKKDDPCIANGNTWAESEVKTRREELIDYSKDDVKIFDEVETAYDFAVKILSLYEHYYYDKKPSYDNAANFGSDVLTLCKRIQARKGE